MPELERANLDASHLHALVSFARDLGVSEDDVATAYRLEVQRLGLSAKITSYIAILAEKRAREAIRRQSTKA